MNILRAVTHYPGSYLKSLNRGLSVTNTIIIDDKIEVWPNEYHRLIVRSL